jgi:hypothetical protein
MFPNPLHLLVIMFNPEKATSADHSGDEPGRNSDHRAESAGEREQAEVLLEGTSTYVSHSSYILSTSRPLLVSSFRPRYVLVHILIAYLSVGHYVDLIQLLGFVLS